MARRAATTVAKRPSRPASCSRRRPTRYNEAQDALKEGDLATYQRKINEMNDRIEEAQKALEQ